MPARKPVQNPLRRRWEIALAVAGVAPHQVAARWGVNKRSINGVLAGDITSARLHAKIEGFIAKYSPRKEAA